MHLVEVDADSVLWGSLVCDEGVAPATPEFGSFLTRPLKMKGSKFRFILKHNEKKKKTISRERLGEKI